MPLPGRAGKPKAAKPEVAVEAPNELWAWDIERGPTRCSCPRAGSRREGPDVNDDPFYLPPGAPDGYTSRELAQEVLHDPASTGGLAAMLQEQGAPLTADLEAAARAFRRHA